METTENIPKKKWDWKERKPNNIYSINAGPTTGFFEMWCIYQRPIVDMTDREINVIASFLKQRYELSKIISDPVILDSQLMSNDTFLKVAEECGITRQHLYVLMNSLRKKHIITENGIHPKLIPNIRGDDKGYFQFLLLFKDPEYKEPKNDEV